MDGVGFDAFDKGDGSSEEKVGRIYSREIRIHARLLQSALRRCEDRQAAYGKGSRVAGAALLELKKQFRATRGARCGSRQSGRVRRTPDAIGGDVASGGAKGALIGAVAGDAGKGAVAAAVGLGLMGALRRR